MSSENRLFYAYILPHQTDKFFWLERVEAHSIKDAIEQLVVEISYAYENAIDDWERRFSDQPILVLDSENLESPRSIKIYPPSRNKWEWVNAA